MATAQVINDILQQAEALFHQGQFAAASQLLSDGIAQAPSAKLWNDWAAVQVSLDNSKTRNAVFARHCSSILAPRRPPKTLALCSLPAVATAKRRRFCSNRLPAPRRKHAR